MGKTSRVILVLVLFSVLALILGSYSNAENWFVDVPKDHSAYDAILQLQKRGIIEVGVDGTFRGDDDLTRYEFADFPYRKRQ